MTPAAFIPARLRDGAGLLRAREFRNVFLAQSVSVFGTASPRSRSPSPCSI